MKKHYWNKEIGKRLLAIFLAVCAGMVPVLYTPGVPAVWAAAPSPSGTVSASPPFPSAPGVVPSCDEAYYATLDYYGKLTDSSVVKSYLVNGSSAITDYGSYDKIINLTDDRQPKISDGAVTFDLSGDTPKRFYFEGKTEQPFRDLPWTISLSYRLNGVPAPADRLAGKTGLVEINLDVAPNPSASEYNRNNLVLAATAAFNADDILSLEADGAQVQLVGNLRSVLCMVLPGEERHFVIRVGADDFSFDGMVFLALPATLAQLGQIADLRDARDRTEDSYHAINDSLEVILDTLNGMSGSLSSTASGLDRLNAARATISAGKGNLYGQADQALGNLNIVADALAPAASHLDTASRAITDITDALTALTRNATALKPELETTRSIIQKLQDDTADIRELTASVESYNKSAARTATALKNDLDDLGDGLDDLQASLSGLRKALGAAMGISPVGPVSVGGMTSAAEVREAVSQAQSAYSQYEAFLAANGLTEDILSFRDFLTQYGGKSESDADGIIALLGAANDPDFEQQLELMETANSIISVVNKTIREANGLVSDIAEPSAGVIGDLGSLCDLLGHSGLSGDLESMSRLAANLLKDLKEHEGEAAGLTEHLDELGDLAVRVSGNADSALDLIQGLNGTVNSYVPDAQKALADAQTLSASLAESLRNTNSFLGSSESLLRSSGGNLDTGTKQTLSGLAEALRRSSSGLAETDTIRSAKDTITTLIDDEWDKHTGGENNLLLMDAQAKPVSLTSPRNGTPSSVQYLMRSQEIKADSGKDSGEAAQAETGGGTFWTRVKDMFRDFWTAVTGLFSRDR